MHGSAGQQQVGGEPGKTSNQVRAFGPLLLTPISAGHVAAARRRSAIASCSSRQELRGGAGQSMSTAWPAGARGRGGGRRPHAQPPFPLTVAS